MKSLDELRAIREKMQDEIGQRSDDAEKTRVVVGMATCGIASGARPVLNLLSEEVQKRHLENIVVTQTGCIGLCQFEPIVEVFEPGKEKVTYVKVNEEKALEILEQHLINGKVVEKYLLHADEIEAVKEADN
ncbi:MAG: (2Fe-2S) ferredoxin domain-containing protein [Lachnospiraceae bacterium]|nr:(2Fe-2S) ferredoxin domain-containing protein [Lachnospiraceae bacterium]